MSLAGEYNIRARRGKTFDLTFYLYDDKDRKIPTNLTGWFFHFQVRKALLADSPADPILDWQSSPLDGIVGPTGQGRVHIPAVTMEIPVDTYRFELERVRIPGGGGEILKYPLLSGDFEILGEVLR
jgi:hypothetical protein